MAHVFPVFYEKDISGGLQELAIPPALDYTVERYRLNARGGPLDARIDAAGNIRDIWQLTTMLRTPVELDDERGEAVWWGFINEVRITTPILEYVLSLENMANSVAVAYSTRAVSQAAAASRATTSYATDAESIAEFGTKQRLLSLSDAYATQATQGRDTALARLKYPIPEVELRAGEIGAEIRCVGWWDTLGWAYYQEPATSESYIGQQTGVVAFGDNTNHQVAQTFEVTSTQDFNPTSAGAMLRTVGSPGDSVQFDIHADGVTAPGASIVSGTIAASELESGTPLWEAVDLTTATDLSAGVTYWLVLSRTGAQSVSDHYEVGIDDNAGYDGTGGVGDGSFWTYDGGTWSEDASVDMPFDVGGVRDTEDQLTNILADATVGQFFAGSEIADTGLSMPARNTSGDVTALDIVAEIMEAGTTNDKRLVSYVTQTRRVVIEEEAATGSNLLVTDDLTFQTDNGVDIPKHHLHKIVRRWCTPKNLVTILGQTVRLADLANIYIEEAEYNAQRDELRVRTRESRDVFDMARLVAQ